jgi:hypothetical protein
MTSFALRADRGVLAVPFPELQSSKLNADATACAYGLFQVAFAEMVETLAVAVYELRKQREPSLTIAGLRNLRKPGELLTELKDELKQFDDRSAPAEYVQEVRVACGEARQVLNWRNARVHCRILRTETGVALQSWDGKPLPLTSGDCWKYINRAHVVSSTLQAYVSQLVGALEFYKAVDELYAQIMAEEIPPDEVDESDELYQQILADETPQTPDER